MLLTIEYFRLIIYLFLASDLKSEISIESVTCEAHSIPSNFTICKHEVIDR